MSKLFKNEAGYTRILRDERDSLIQRVAAELSNVATKMEANHELDFKEDYGDLDLITLCAPDVDVVKRLGYCVGVRNVSKNGNVISFLFQDSPKQEPLRRYHVDIICCYSELEYQNMIAYYRNGVVTNFMGQFLHASNVKAGHNGVFFRYKDKRKNAVPILFEPDLRKFYKDYFDISIGELVFKSYEELLAYLLNTPFFCGSKRYLETSSSDKKRALKLHGLVHRLYIDIANQAEPKYVYTDYTFQPKPEHQAIIDSYIAEYETTLDVNNSNRKSLFEFLKEHQVPNTFYKEIFGVVMPILNEVKMKQNS